MFYRLYLRNDKYNLSVQYHIILITIWLRVLGELLSWTIACGVKHQVALCVFYEQQCAALAASVLLEICVFLDFDFDRSRNKRKWIED